MLFEPAKRPAYRRSRKLEMGGRSAERSSLRSGNEYADVIEIGRFAHAECCGAAMIIRWRRDLEQEGSLISAVYCNRFQSHRQNQHQRTPLGRIRLMTVPELSPNKK